jgi:hypothetical protein
VVCGKIFCVRIFEYLIMSVRSSSSSESEFDDDVVPILANNSDSREIVGVPKPSKKLSSKAKMNKVVCNQETGPQSLKRVAPKSSKMRSNKSKSSKQFSGCRLLYASLARTAVKGISVKSDKPRRVRKQEAVGDVQLEHVQRHPEAKVASVIVMSLEHGGDITFPPALSSSVTLLSCEKSHSDTKAEPVLAMVMEEDGNVSVPHPSTSASDSCIK